MDLLSNPKIIEHSHKSVNYTIFDVKWIPHSARFVAFGATAGGLGVFHTYSFVWNESQKVMGIESTKKVEQRFRIKCGTFGFSPTPSRKMATGSMNGKMAIWDIDKSENPIQTYEAHKQTVHSIDSGGMNCGPPEIVTGSMDGCVKVWDSRQKRKCVASLEPESEKQECWAVAIGNSFDDENRIVACGFANGDLKLFDLKTNKILWETNLKSGIIKIEFDKKEEKMNTVLVTCLEGKFFVFDLLIFNENMGYVNTQQKMDNRSSVWSGSHLPQNRDLFATGHGNGELNLWKYVFPKERKIGDMQSKGERGVPGKIELVTDSQLSSQPLCAIDWNKQKVGLAVVGAFDQ